MDESRFLLSFVLDNINLCIEHFVFSFIVHIFLKPNGALVVMCWKTDLGGSEFFYII